MSSNDQFAMTEEPTWTYIKLHLHDMRNHLNGIAMEAVLADSMLTDGNDESREAVNRIRAEVVQMERALRSLATRFVTPQPDVVSATDVFTRWMSRFGTASSDSALDWKCETGGELIQVDMKVVGDALCELLPTGLSQPAEISASASDREVRFLVREKLAPDALRCGLDRLPPGIEDVIARNGGSCQRTVDEEAGERITCCSFPCQSDEPHQPETI